MREQKAGEFRSSVYTQRPTYADFSAPAKFQAIQGIIAKRLMEHPNAMCSYSGGSDSSSMCFAETAQGKYRLRPLYYVSNADKQWYKEYYGLRYSDAYEVYGLKRTGCCGCAISARAVTDLELIRPYEPNVVKAAWAIFGDSYMYRAQYNAYKERRRAEDGRRNNSR